MYLNSALEQEADCPRDIRSTDSYGKPRERPSEPTKTSAGSVESSAPATEPLSRPAATASPSGSYSSYKTAEERAAFIKQQAEQRMAERLAALGLRAPPKAGETAQQRQEREKKEREDKLRQAEEEDARREQERQRRLADEQVVPPSASKPAAKKPPPPPTRKNKVEVAQHDVKQAEAESKRADQEIAEQALREQQQSQEAERKALE